MAEKRLAVIKARETVLRGSIGSPKATRRPQAFFDFGGKILNWAFGVATDERLTDLDRAFGLCESRDGPFDLPGSSPGNVGK